MMRYFKFLSIFIAILSLSSCEKEEEVIPKDYPFVIIDKIDIQINESITINSRIYYNGELQILDHGFIIEDRAVNEDFELTILESLGPCKNDQTQFNFTLKSGLVMGMKFSVRAFTKTSETTVYSNERTFESPVGGYKLNYKPSNIQ